MDIKYWYSSIWWPRPFKVSNSLLDSTQWMWQVLTRLHSTHKTYLSHRTRTAGATAGVSTWGGRARPWCSASVSWDTSDQAAASSHPRTTRTSSMDSTPKSKKKGLNTFHLYSHRQCFGSGIRCLYDPGSRIWDGKKTRSGSGMNIPDHVFEI